MGSILFSKINIENNTVIATLLRSKSFEGVGNLFFEVLTKENPNNKINSLRGCIKILDSHGTRCLGMTLWFLICLITSHCYAKPIVIILDPADTLREIAGSTYERGLTLKCAEVLQKKLEMMHENVRVILTRLPGESLEPLQNAHVSNRIDADCYVSIHFYHEKQAKPRLYVYYYAQNPITDGWKKTAQDLAFIPFDQAHNENNALTKQWGTVMTNILENTVYNPLFDFCGLFGIPHKALVGIRAPAFCIEAGIRHKEDWQVYVAPLAHALLEIIKQIP